MTIISCTIRVNTPFVSTMLTMVHFRNGFHNKNPGLPTTMLVTIFRNARMQQMPSIACLVWKLTARKMPSIACLVWKLTARRGAKYTSKKRAHNTIHIKLGTRRLNRKTRPQQIWGDSISNILLLPQPITQWRTKVQKAFPSSNWSTQCAATSFEKSQQVSSRSNCRHV